MGGRGAASGVSKGGKSYGTEYTTLYQSGNIKFVRYNGNSATAPMETMTKGRVYVTVNYNNNLKSITYYNKQNKRFKQIDIDHPHKINGENKQPHKHKGYLHNEKGDYTLSQKEQKLLDRVIKTWYNKKASKSVVRNTHSDMNVRCKSGCLLLRVQKCALFFIRPKGVIK